jgi:hypothetical protein
MEKELKEIIVSGVEKAVKLLAEKSHPRLGVKDFSEIKHKKLNNFYLFYHPIFKNVSSSF